VSNEGQCHTLRRLSVRDVVGRRRSIIIRWVTLENSLIS